MRGMCSLLVGGWGGDTVEREIASGFMSTRAQLRHTSALHPPKTGPAERVPVRKNKKSRLSSQSRLRDLFLLLYQL